jgi:hypothetical protein
VTFDRVSLSPTGSAAALFSQSQGHIYVFVNLAQAPTLLGAFSVRDAAGLNTFAITDDGRTAALGFSSGETGSLYIQTLNGPIRPIPSLQRVSAVAFLRGSDTLIAADDAQNEIYSVTGGQVVAIATADNGVAGPVAVAASNDNQRILVANASAGSVTVIGPTGISDPLPCHCTLSGLYPTNADSVFRLTQFSGGPVLLVDAAGATPRLIFARNSNSY